MLGVDDVDPHGAEWRPALVSATVVRVPVALATPAEIPESRNLVPAPDVVFTTSPEQVGSDVLRASVAITIDRDDDEGADEFYREYVSRLWTSDWDCPEDSVYDDQ